MPVRCNIHESDIRGKPKNPVLKSGILHILIYVVREQEGLCKMTKIQYKFLNIREEMTTK